MRHDAAKTKVDAVGGGAAKVDAVGIDLRVAVLALALMVLPSCHSQHIPPSAEMLVSELDVPVSLLDTRLAAGATDIRFKQARAMAGTAAGMLYVADSGENTIRVLRFDRDSLSDVMRIGTSGSGAAEFSGVSDVGVVSGIFLVAADRGNGRIQRFDRDGALVELFPFNPGDDAPGPVFVQNAARGVTGRSEPLAIATAPNDDLFMVDARSSSLFRTDRRRERLERIGTDVLTEPLDVLAWGARLLVLDAAHGIVVFDLLGTHVRTLRINGLERLALLSDGRLLGLSSSSAVLFDDRLVPVRRIRFRIDAPVRDVFQRGDLLYLLTDTALYVTDLTG